MKKFTKAQEAYVRGLLKDISVLKESRRDALDEVDKADIKVQELEKLQAGDSSVIRQLHRRLDKAQAALHILIVKEEREKKRSGKQGPMNPLGGEIYMSLTDLGRQLQQVSNYLNEPVTTSSLNNAFMDVCR